MCSPEAGTWGSSESFLKCVYGRQKGVIAGRSCLSKLSSIRKYFRAAQLSLSDVRVQRLAPSAWHYGDVMC